MTLSSMFQKKNKKEIIQAIREGDEKAFTRWVSHPKYQTSFFLSLKALRYLLIPPRLFEIVDDPTGIGISIYRANEYTLDATVYYARPFPLIRSLQPLFPHTRLSIIYDTLLEITLNNHQNDHGLKKLFVNEYEDTERYRHKRIGTSFFQQLHHCAKLMGFRCIYAYPAPGTMSFYTEKLQWLRLGKLRPEVEEFLHDDCYLTSGDYMVLDFMNALDRELLLDPEPNEEGNKYSQYIRRKIRQYRLPLVH